MCSSVSLESWLSVCECLCGQMHGMSLMHTFIFLSVLKSDSYDVLVRADARVELLEGITKEHSESIARLKVSLIVSNSDTLKDHPLCL